MKEVCVLGCIVVAGIFIYPYVIAPQFHSLQITVVGLKAELYPIPRNSLKIALERVTPDWLAKAILGKFGSMVVVEAIRS